LRNEGGKRRRTVSEVTVANVTAGAESGGCKWSGTELLLAVGWGLGSLCFLSIIASEPRIMTHDTLLCSGSKQLSQ
jgi:hypothetical protein